jgi:hypothetical protein
VTLPHVKVDQVKRSGLMWVECGESGKAKPVFSPITFLPEIEGS